MGQATTWTGVFFYHCSDELMYSRASALLLLLLKLVVSVLEMASNKRKAKKMLKFKENDIAAHCITGREYLVRSIRENKCGQRVVELIGHKCNIVREIRTDENGEFIMRELTTEEFEEIEKALYKEGNRKVIATLEGD